MARSKRFVERREGKENVGRNRERMTGKEGKKQDGMDIEGMRGSRRNVVKESKNETEVMQRSRGKERKNGKKREQE